MQNKSISVIVPIWDGRGGLLEKCLQSLVTQEYDNFEILAILDGGGTQDARDILDKYKDNSLIKILKTDKRCGYPVGPRNVGIFVSNSDLVAFMDSDDLSLPYRLKLSADSMGHADCIYTDYIKESNGIFSPNKCAFGLYKEFLTQNYINFNTTMYKRETLVKEGGLREEMLYCEDYELHLRLSKKGYRFTHIPVPTIVYRQHNMNLESSFINDQEKWKLLAKTKHLLPNK